MPRRLGRRQGPQPVEAAVLAEPAPVLSPLEQLQASLASGAGSIADVRLRRTAEELDLEGGFTELLCLPLLRGFHLHPYQEQTVRQVLRRLGGRALLADEVGLGKTIEALCIVKELDVRGLARRVLILTPATLVTQWIEELETKFQLPFHRGRKREHWRAYPRIVASLDTAKSPRHASEIQQADWDLIIVDEAHRLKNRRTRNFRFVNRLRSPRLLLLSATPFQNNLVELFNIVTLLRPGQLGSEKDFKTRHLVRGARGEVNDPAGLRELLGEVMVRNRRGEVGVEFTARKAETRRLEMGPEQRALYKSAVDFCRRRFPEVYGDAATLVAVGYLRMLCASPFRFRESLVGNMLPRAKEAGAAETVREVKDLIELADAVPWDVKLEALAGDLASHDEKAVVFTHYRGLLRYVAARLRKDRASLALFHGAMSADDKDAAVEEFRGPARVLLSTDAGSEGRNLQFARRIVNYDLPWNPMKIEQRIGRVHRMGQTRDVIVVSYTLQDTIEDELLQIIERKLGMFQLIVGEVELILGKLHVEKKLAELFLASRNDAELKQRMADFGREIDEMRTDYEQVREDNEHVLAGMGATAG